MNKNIEYEIITKAVNGDKSALEEILNSAQDIVFNLSLRMLGTVHDAEDATQDILINIMTKLSSFRNESAFTTWVYRLASNYLINYQKSMFAKHPLNFEFYGNDIINANLESIDAIDDVCRKEYAEELKNSCSNVMLQCLDAESRCIFILGTMFKIDSKIAGEALGMTPENYRQRLSRTRKKVAEFLGKYCGLTSTGICSCYKRVDYAITQHRINPDNLEFKNLNQLDDNSVQAFKEEMEQLDELACTFESFPNYSSPIRSKDLLAEILNSDQLGKIKQL